MIYIMALLMLKAKHGLTAQLCDRCDSGTYIKLLVCKNLMLPGSKYVIRIAPEKQL